ncbi:MAG: hypothetical protein HY744_02130 [Deltaproteobacteria bacterium]|nr:hypothetical protein [Deltaproteobacteria bacterium]
MSPAVTSFAVRLRDLLSTVEVAAVLGANETRLRGLGEQLQFACLAVPCAEALVAIEIGHLGRLQVPGVATAEGWRAAELEFPPSGTPFAFLLGGGSGFAAEIAPGDALLEVLRPVLETEPRHAVLLPLRLGAGVVGGAALLRVDEPMGDAELALGERLAEVLALTIESFRTERILFEIFARALPELCGPEAPTGLPAAIEQYVHGLRLTPAYRRKLALAEAVGRIAAHGDAETRLAADVLGRVEAYLHALVSGAEPAGGTGRA